VQLVIADTGPINYLILIGHIDILPALFQKVILPAVVRDELKHRKAPAAVQQWIANPPAWAEVHPTPHAQDPAMAQLDSGEQDAIALAIELHADLILMDDRDGILVARTKGFRVSGTLGILAMAAAHGLLSLAVGLRPHQTYEFLLASKKSWISSSPTLRAQSNSKPAGS
jgi:predicted nucleic acid-binding protein